MYLVLVKLHLHLYKNQIIYGKTHCFVEVKETGTWKR
jgi:hypothetical protein